MNIFVAYEFHPIWCLFQLKIVNSCHLYSYILSKKSVTIGYFSSELKIGSIIIFPILNIGDLQCAIIYQPSIYLSYFSNCFEIIVLNSILRISLGKNDIASIYDLVLASSRLNNKRFKPSRYNV